MTIILIEIIRKYSTIRFGSFVLIVFFKIAIGTRETISACLVFAVFLPYSSKWDGRLDLKDLYYLNL